ncbi:hypothetical protein BSKO_13290 [Bryopsis sp. KO-2023]|nr:hypothetical protein BSKO_13290 [Bryopsis sp. KO-2023]
MNSPRGGAMTEDSLFVGHTPNMPSSIPHHLRDDPDKGRTFGFIVSGQGFNYTIKDSSFVNYDGSDAVAFGSCSHCNFPNNKFQDARVTTVQNVSFTDSPNKVKWGSQHTFINPDGSLVGGSLSTMVTSKWSHLEGVCSALEEWDSSLECPREEMMATLEIHSPNPFSYFKNDPMFVRQSDEGGTSDWSSVPYRNEKWKNPKNGWAVGLLTGHTYEMHWKKVDFTSITLDVTNVLAEHYFYIRFNYSDFRDHFKIHYNGEEVLGSTVSLPVASEGTGASFQDMINGTLTVLFSGKNDVAFGTKQASVVKIEGDRCPREGCPEPEVVDVDREPFIRRWSNATQWPNGFLPEHNQDVEVKEEWRLLMDIPPPKMKTLDIKGELIFDEAMASTTLEADSILLTGELKAGNSSVAFMRSATIILHGNQGSVPLQIAGDIDIGPKALIVLGKLRLFGQRRTVIWTRLAETAQVGDTEIKVESSVDWQGGEELMLSSPSHDQHHSETAVIKRRVDGRTFELEEPLEFKHFGDLTNHEVKGKILDVRTEVGLLSRNIKIMGTETPDRYGAHVAVYRLVDEEAARIFEGSTQLSGVEFYNGGQFQTVRSTFDFQGANGGLSFVRNCAFHGNQNTAMYLKRADNIEISGNVIYETVGSSVDVLESDNIVLQNNLAALTHLRVPNPGGEVFEAIGNFMICCFDVAANGPTRKCEGVTLTGNVAAGSFHLSYFVRGESCDTQPSKSAYQGNVGHASRIGVLFNTKTDGECAQISGFAIHHTTEVGIGFNSKTPRVEVEDVVLADNLVGIGLLPCNGRTAGTAEIKDIVLVGNSDNGGCGYDEDVECMDRSVTRETGVGSRTGGSGSAGGGVLYSGCGHR